MQISTKKNTNEKRHTHTHTHTHTQQEVSQLRVKVILLSILAIAIVFSAYLFGAYSYPRNFWPLDLFRKIKQPLLISTSNLPANHYFIEIVEQHQLFHSKADIVMIGDSITHYGNWQDIFPNVKIANRGIGGDSTFHIMRRIDSILSVNPTKAFLMVGLNDFGMNRSVTDVFKDYINIVEILTEKKINVYIQSTIECRKSVCGIKVEQIRGLNKKLRAYASTKQLTYIDLNQEITNDNEGLLSNYTYDGIHLRSNAYVKWAELIAPFVNSN